MPRINRFMQQPASFYEELVRAAHSRDYTLMWIGMLANPDTRAVALKNLNSNLKYIDDIGRLLWLRPNALAGLLTELRSGHEVVNSLLMPTSHQMARLHEVLRLIRRLASEPDFRLETLTERIPILLIPYLSNDNSCFDVLRLLALNVIDSLVKPVAERQVVEHLIESGVLNICLSSLVMENQISKNISVSILYQVLMDETGLEFICQSYELFSRIFSTLKNSFVIQDGTEYIQLLKYIIGCFLCFTQNARTCEILRIHLPDQLRKISSSSSLLKERDEQIVVWLTQLMDKLGLN